MTTRTVLPLAAALLASCTCLDFKEGTINVDTDCQAGAITHSSLQFAQVPGGLGQSQVTKLLANVPEELRSQLGDIACKELVNPKSIGDLCAPAGVGGPLDQSVTFANATDTRVFMCGTQMFVLGGFDNGLFFCRADSPVIDNQVWFVSCHQFSLSTKAPTGTCQGVVEFDVQQGI